MTSIINQNVAAIETALRDYVAHTYTAQGMFANDETPSADFVSHLATDSAHAKSDLRKLFRKAKGWDEDLQAVVVNGTQTHDPDDNAIAELATEILLPAYCGRDVDFCDMLRTATAFFYTGEEGRGIADALKHFIGNKFRPDRKKSTLFQCLAKAVGVYSDKAGSRYQRLYAQLADELNGRKLDFKLFLSINPAHILTASNPVCDTRGQCLVSCHSLNREDYSYGTGNIGYARDDITFVVFTVDNPNDAETLNNRKTSRQFFFYRPYSGVLLQSRLYSTTGGTYNEQPISKLYRDLVQRTISGAEDAINLWQTRTYQRNDFGIDFHEHPFFSGYSDWREFSGEIKISVRNDCLESARGATFTIGESSLCVNCGAEMREDNNGEPHWRCLDCDDEYATCAECGQRIYNDCGTWATDAAGNEVFVCDTCLTSDYFYCQDCGQYHHVSNGTTIASGETVCRECLEKFYVQCEDCGEWIDNCRANHICGRTVCSDCFSDNYVICDECGELEYYEDAYTTNIDGVFKTLCAYCYEHHTHTGHNA